MRDKTPPKKESHFKKSNLTVWKQGCIKIGKDWKSNKINYLNSTSVAEMICWKPNTTRVMLLDKLMYCHHDTFTGPETASTFLLTCYKMLIFSHAFCRFLQKANLKALPRTKIISKNKAISRYYSHKFVPLSLCSHCSSSHEIPSLSSLPVFGFPSRTCHIHRLIWS